MLEKLSEVLRKATDKIANAIFLDRNLVDSIVKDLQRALIEADVSISLVKDLSDKIRKAAMNERIKGIDKKEHMIKVLHDQLKEILGEHRPLRLKKTKHASEEIDGAPRKAQDKIMLLGLYGAGKTTTAGKLANYFSKRGNKVLTIGLDTHRPAAAEQLEQNAKKNKLNYLIDREEKNPVKLWKKHEKEIKGHNLVIIDTAGRHTLDKNLVNEIKALDKTIQPTEKILVIPGDIGQAAKKQAKEFLDAVQITGVIVTRMDSTARGGGALTACAETKAPVYFITTGEKINDIEPFNPEAFISRLLGMGDLETLIEKIKSISDSDSSSEEKLKKIQEQGKLTLDDVVEQVKSMNSLGGFEKIKSLVPGFSNIQDKVPKGALESQEAKIAKWEHITKSMTAEERENPEVLEKQTSRIQRIAKGSGSSTSDVRALLKQYKLLNEIVKSGLDNMGSDGPEGLAGGLSQKQMMKLAKKFGKVKRIRF